MRTENEEIRENLKYLSLLARDYPSQAAAASEIISTQALLKLPKGTEHFMSDLHGENEAFVHILNSASGVIREKVDAVLGDTMPEAARAELATLIYYPTEKLPQLKALYYDGLYPLTEHTITDFRLLADQLAEIRASGFAYECEESTRGIRCIGVPLRKNGKVVAALSVAFPLERYSDAAAASARQALDEARRQIERMLCSVELQF